MLARLPPDVAVAFGAMRRVARALSGAGTLSELAHESLSELLAALDLEACALYLPAAAGRPALRRFVSCAGGSSVEVRDELVLDVQAWRLAVGGGHPLVMREQADWLVRNPFVPPARHWFVLPMIAAGHLAGAVVAARGRPVDLDPATVALLTVLGDQLSAGIAMARLRQEAQRGEIDRERIRLAADVHDGIAQDLALAKRELHALDRSPLPSEARASCDRAREAVGAAHRIVRARLVELSAAAPLGGVRAAVDETCERFARRGLPVRVALPREPVAATPHATAVLLRVLSEALTNADKHAGARHVDVTLGVRADELELVVADDGTGFDPERGGAGGLGLALMRDRASEAGGAVELVAAPGAGTRVVLRLPARGAGGGAFA